MRVGSRWKKDAPKTVFGVVFDALMTRRKDSPYAIAERSNLSPGAMSRWRLGSRDPKRETLEELVNALFPISADEVDLLYVAAGFIPPTWQQPMLRRLAKQAGYDADAMREAIHAL